MREWDLPCQTDGQKRVCEEKANSGASDGPGRLGAADGPRRDVYVAVESIGQTPGSLRAVSLLRYLGGSSVMVEARLE